MLRPFSSINWQEDIGKNFMWQLPCCVSSGQTNTQINIYQSWMWAAQNPCFYRLYNIFAISIDLRSNFTHIYIYIYITEFRWIPEILCESKRLLPGNNVTKVFLLISHFALYLTDRLFQNLFPDWITFLFNKAQRIHENVSNLFYLYYRLKQMLI